MNYRASDDPKTALLRAIAEQDAKRGRPLSASEKLANLKTALTHCDKCDNAIEMNWPYCAWCGYQLMDPK